jgi:hypothetical protein
MVREVPVDLHPAIESAMATSQQLRVHLVGTLPGEAGSTDAGQTGTRRATIQEPLSPEEAASAEIQPLQPLYPESATGAEIRQPPKTIRPLTPQEGRRLRPGETDPRGTRRPGDTSPRPRARDEDR